VLVVISVMGGWLRMFRESFHGLSGDIIISKQSLAGFPNYQEMIDEIEKLPEVAAEAAKPAPVLQVVEPQVPRAAKPAALAARPAPPAAAVPAPDSRPVLRKTGACEIKPVMTDQDLVNCGATPR